MPLKIRWIWEVYLVLNLILAFGKAYHFFAPHSPQHLYLQILYSFNHAFLTAYFLNLTQVILDIVHCLPLGLYIYHVSLFRPLLWKCLFILRVIFDIAGHPYEVITVASFYHAEPKIGFLMLLLGISPYIPSYWACWQYAFKREKLFGSQQHVPRPPRNSSYAAKN